MTDISRITRAAGPLTLAGVPTGFLPWLMTDLARAATKRAVFIATDEAEMRGVADTAHWFAPEVRVLTFPAWDCLPYDRASPSLRVTAERMATLSALQDKAAGPQLLVTTVNAASQRTLTPFRLRQLVAKLAPGERIDRDDLAKLLQANGYVRTETVTDAGDYAVRGSLVDLFPSGMDHALRLDAVLEDVAFLAHFGTVLAGMSEEDVVELRPLDLHGFGVFGEGALREIQAVRARAITEDELRGAFPGESGGGDFLPDAELFKNFPVIRQ